jgi:hypothetical protein
MYPLQILETDLLEGNDDMISENYQVIIIVLLIGQSRKKKRADRNLRFQQYLFGTWNGYENAYLLLLLVCT